LLSHPPYLAIVVSLPDVASISGRSPASERKVYSTHSKLTPHGEVYTRLALTVSVVASVAISTVSYPRKVAVNVPLIVDK